MRKPSICAWLMALLMAVLSVHPALAAVKSNLTITVNKATTTTSVTASTPAVNIGTATQFAIAVMPTTPSVPTGTISVSATGANTGTQVAASLPVSSNGTATWSVTFPTADTYTVQAVYSGDTNYQGSQGAASQLIAPPADFSLSLPSSITVTKGQTGTGSISLSALNGFTGTVTLACSGAPYKSACGFNTSQVSLASSLLQTASASVSSSSSPVTLSITTAGVTVTTASFILMLFGIGWPKLRAKIKRSYVVAGIGVMCLGVAGCIASNRYTQNDGTPTGSYNITVTAIAGNITHSATVTLHVVGE